MPDRHVRTNIDEVITLQGAVIRHLRRTLSGLLDELDESQGDLSRTLDESAALREALAAAHHLLGRRYPAGPDRN